jgi:hypothetical protein
MHVEPQHLQPGRTLGRATPGTCCLQLAPPPDPWIDLSIRWGAATSTSGPCSNGTCPPCPMVHTLLNAPLLGTTLQLGLDQASPNSLAVCAVNFGPCNNTGPVMRRCAAQPWCR